MQEQNIPEESRLLQYFPYPFNPETTIEFCLPEVANVLTRVYNIKGELVRTIGNEFKIAGTHRVS